MKREYTENWNWYWITQIWKCHIKHNVNSINEASYQKNSTDWENARKRGKKLSINFITFVKCVELDEYAHFILYRIMPSNVDFFFMENYFSNFHNVIRIFLHRFRPFSLKLLFHLNMRKKTPYKQPNSIKPPHAGLYFSLNFEFF